MSLGFEVSVVLLLMILISVVLVYLDNVLNMQVDNASSFRTQLILISVQLNALQQIAMHLPAPEPIGPSQSSSTQTTPLPQQ